MVLTRRLPLRNHRSAAFSLAEMVVGLAISSLVITSILWSLVSVARSTSANKQDLSRKETVIRILDLLQDEARNAVQVEVSSSTAPLTALDGCSTRPLMILRGQTSQEDISYALKSVTSGDRDWMGPNTLVRCGLPYGTGDTLNAAATRTEQVVLDAMPADNSFVPTTSTGTTNGSTGSLNRTLRLSMQSGSGSNASSLVQVPINANNAYDLSSRSNAANCTTTTLATTGCTDTVRGSRLFQRGFGGSEVSGLPGAEDVVQFQGISRSEVSLRGPNGNGNCNSDYCSVQLKATGQSTVVRDGDVLIFKDGEIRL